MSDVDVTTDGDITDVSVESDTPIDVSVFGGPGPQGVPGPAGTSKHTLTALPPGGFWSPPDMDNPVANAFARDMDTFPRHSVWFPPRGDYQWSAAGIRVETAAGAATGATMQVTFYGVTPDYTPDTSVVLAVLTFPLTATGDVILAFPSPIVIPSPRGMFACFTSPAFSANATARLRGGLMNGSAPYGRWNQSTSNPFVAYTLAGLQVPVVFLKRAP